MKEILGGNKMSEPTRQEIKEAFKETLERWEKIVEDVEYYHKSECQLCQVYEGTTTCHEFCPIRDYGGGDKHRICWGTPFHEFQQNKTLANALVELNFLRKVYIWWMEKEKPTGVVRKEEKKEEWVDVTHEISWQIKDYPDAELPYLLYGLNSDGEEVGYINETGKHIRYDYKKEYRLEQLGETFRILKKA